MNLNMKNGRNMLHKGVRISIQTLGHILATTTSTPEITPGSNMNPGILFEHKNPGGSGLTMFDHALWPPIELNYMKRGKRHVATPLRITIGET